MVSAIAVSRNFVALSTAELILMPFTTDAQIIDAKMSPVPEKLFPNCFDFAKSQSFLEIIPL